MNTSSLDGGHSQSSSALGAVKLNGAIFLHSNIVSNAKLAQRFPAGKRSTNLLRAKPGSEVRVKHVI